MLSRFAKFLIFIFFICEVSLLASRGARPDLWQPQGNGPACEVAVKTSSGVSGEIAQNDIDRENHETTPILDYPSVKGIKQLSRIISVSGEAKSYLLELLERIERSDQPEILAKVYAIYLRHSDTGRFLSQLLELPLVKHDGRYIEHYLQDSKWAGGQRFVAALITGAWNASLFWRRQSSVIKSLYKDSIDDFAEAYRSFMQRDARGQMLRNRMAMEVTESHFRNGELSPETLNVVNEIFKSLGISIRDHYYKKFGSDSTELNIEQIAMDDITDYYNDRRSILRHTDNAIRISILSSFIYTFKVLLFGN